MHHNAELVEKRVARFVRERIEPALYRQARPLEVTAWEVPDEPVPFAEAVPQRFEPFATGTAWGKPWGTTWFHVTGSVPAEWRGERLRAEGLRAEVIVDLGFSSVKDGFQAEGLVYTRNGRIVKAVEPLNRHIRLEAVETLEALEALETLGPSGDAIDFYIEAASNPDMGSDWAFAPTPMGDKATAGTAPIYVLRRIDLALRAETVWRLDADIRSLRGLLGELPRDSTRAAQILRALESAVDAVDPDDVAGTAVTARAALAGVLAAPAASGAHRITAVGHAHIDSAWLWPTRETIRKCARTFSNVLDLMDEHDDFVFACSSAQQYAWVEQAYPELFERIRQRVAEGRFIPVGGMWVESDTNMPGGEALARQFVMGSGYFLRTFGVASSTGWLPDSFGYSGALPQIMAAAGITEFLTQKISWNETNAFPHHTFEWEGIDGTRIFTHFPPVDRYNSDLSAADLAHAERTFADKGAANSSLVPFGYGDGGGGPTREMLAAAARTASLEGSPAVRIQTPKRFFDEARAEYRNPPVWSGELYLEFHRGTYTSQARTKRGNRDSERMLREAELWATTAAVRLGAPYPYDELEEAWRQVLLGQFHDILPGTAIAWVYRDAEAAYARVAEQLERVIARAIGALAEGSSPEAADAGGGDPAATGDAPRSARYNASPFEVDGVPPLGAGAAERGGAAVRLERAGDGLVMANDRVRVELDGSGRIRSAVDLASGREAIAPGEAAAELQVFRDTPTQWDAWDIDEHYRRHGQALGEPAALEVVAEGPERVAVRVDREFGASRISQEFALEAGHAALQITTRVDWHERQKLLKLAFPLDVHADSATSEVQFGHVRRPIHQNTSWDAARFETVAHRWVHVGEPGFGVALANDATYGHDITRHPRAGGGTMVLVRQSLVRAPLYPDPEADQGEHVFRSSLVAGAEIADAVREGYRLNLPLRSGGGSVDPLVRVQGDGVLVEAVKLAEDRSGDIIVRLYEAYGRRTAATVTIDAAAGGDIVETDLLERELSQPPALTAVDGATASLALRPFQLVTLRARVG
ncbi:glycosyl hydrolase-related protein [Microbacterium sp. STN6]|uniref:alpha-mannosidase n=1 Tax=Microbacterium sp. STN6 TaxID=2995588 RepID=UPI002260F804|nr:glycoside hydrolase family 38 C-terminal domain-containing protein [Microbacterium sp. STN6]MCX7523263.1 glycosyl hydrolase-related protein [Microbacterium sp. STN6]